MSYGNYYIDLSFFAFSGRSGVGVATVRRNLLRTGITDIKDILGVNNNIGGDGGAGDGNTTWYVDTLSTPAADKHSNQVCSLPQFQSLALVN